MSPKSIARGLGTGMTVTLLVVAFVLALGLIAVFGRGWFTDVTANRQGQTGKEQQIEANGDYRIAAYNHFFDLCARIQTDQEQLRALAHELKTTTDPTRKATLPASITGLKGKFFDDVNQYNADARKSYTLGQFRASDLPYRIDPAEEPITCHA